MLAGSPARSSRTSDLETVPSPFLLRDIGVAPAAGRRFVDTVAVERRSRKEPPMITDQTIIRIGRAVELSHRRARERGDRSALEHV